MKTSQKLEKPCKACITEEVEEQTVKKYKEERFLPTPELDVDHLARFKKAVSTQVRSGWNLGCYPYIPTGNATESYSRREAGSWNREEFSRTCRVKPIISSGKPRVVTLYSSKNSEVLSPLHDALYRSLRREGWLLVGSPTDERIQDLNGDGPYVSVDYKSATDNIRAEYSRAVIEVLKEKSTALSDEESRALDVFGELRFTVDGPAALRGQPMGSLMSFPVLCLINKACVDLALADRAEAGEISWEQFRVHRCLINGDDLLYREFDNSRSTFAGILRHGSLTGLRVNEEKTMVSTVYAELNSTCFKDGRKQKKTNVSVVEWKSEVSDPIGFLADSVCKPTTFRAQLARWRVPIKKAWPKLQGPVPRKFMRELWRFRRELTFRPSVPHQTRPNPFPVVTKPAGYDLTREEEGCYISGRVARLMDECSRSTPCGCGTSSFRFTKRKQPAIASSGGKQVSIQLVFRKEETTTQDTVLELLASAWQVKTKERLVQEDPEDFYWVPDPVFARVGFVMNDGSFAPIGFRIIDALRDYKGNRVCATPDAGLIEPGVGRSADSREAWSLANHREVIVRAQSSLTPGAG